MSKLWIGTEHTRFIDTQGRHVILRGVNLGGDCKLPYPDGGTHHPSDFSDHATVSFIGRPFPASETDEHLGRIASWGFNTLRLLVTWEAVEHRGPEQYDHEYIDYIGRICERAAHFELCIFIDFHQDVWSRMSGGSGAPCWIFDQLGMDYRKFGPAGAAHVMQYRYDYGSQDKRQEASYPTMSWPLNYRMPVNGIMWTAFFAGKTFTPDWMISGKNVQDFLQDHYLGAVQALAERIQTLPNVIGFDTLNEPGLGWIGQKMSERPVGVVSGDFAVGLTGPAWTPLDGLRVARGLRTRIPLMALADNKLVVSQELDINPEEISIWKPGVADPFEKAGAWKRKNDTSSHSNEDFFRVRDKRPIDPENDFIQPFFEKMAETIRGIRKDWLLFTEINPHVIVQGRCFPKKMPASSVNASHWYDVALLVGKKFPAEMTPHEKQVLADKYKFQMGYLRALGDRINGGAPTLIGECGVPYDINDGDSYQRWADGDHSTEAWSPQIAALSMMYDCLDSLLLSSTQWNYTASNRNDLRIGDGWNQEDLSIFSLDQLTDPADVRSGARALEGFCRPYVQRAQGLIKKMCYDASNAIFTVTLAVNPTIRGATEIYVPAHFSRQPAPLITGEATWHFDEKTRKLHITAHAAEELRLEIKAAGSPATGATQ